MHVGQHVAAGQGRVVVIALALVTRHAFVPARHRDVAIDVADECDELQRRIGTVEDVLDVVLDVVSCRPGLSRVGNHHIVSLALTPVDQWLQRGQYTGGIAVDEQIGSQAHFCTVAAVVDHRLLVHVVEGLGDPVVLRCHAVAGVDPAEVDGYLAAVDHSHLAGGRVVADRADGQRHHAHTVHDGGRAHLDQRWCVEVAGRIVRRVDHEGLALVRLDRKEAEVGEDLLVSGAELDVDRSVVRHHHEARYRGQRRLADFAAEVAALNGQRLVVLTLDIHGLEVQVRQRELEGQQLTIVILDGEDLLVRVGRGIEGELL